MPVFLRKLFYNWSVSNVLFPGKDLLTAACTLNSYLPPHVNRADPKVSPLFCESDQFPPSVTIITAQEDALGAEGIQLVEKLQKAGKDVFWYQGELFPLSLNGGPLTLHVLAERQGHGFDKEVKVDTKDALIRDQAYAVARNRLFQATSADGKTLPQGVSSTLGGDTRTDMTSCGSGLPASVYQKGGFRDE